MMGTIENNLIPFYLEKIVELNETNSWIYRF